jgi:hypothetical protein
LSYPKNTTENLFTTENAEISDDFWKRQTQLYCMYYKRAFFIKARKYRRFGNVRIIICWHSKATPQRHVIQAVFSPDIKEKPILPYRFLQKWSG